MSKTLILLTIGTGILAGATALSQGQYMVAILEFILVGSFCLIFEMDKQNKKLLDLLNRTNGLLNEIHGASKFDPGANRADVSEG